MESPAYLTGGLPGKGGNVAESIDRGDASKTARSDSPHEDLKDKGLEHDAVGFLASVVLGVSCVAPAYALTATLGPTVSEVGLKMPAVFLAGLYRCCSWPMLTGSSTMRRRTAAPRSRGR